MEHTAPETLGGPERVVVGRLLRVGTLAALLSAGANGIVLVVASSLLGAVVIPPDETVTLGRVLGASVSALLVRLAYSPSSAASPGARCASSGAPRPLVCSFRSSP